MCYRFIISRGAEGPGREIECDSLTVYQGAGFNLIYNIICRGVHLVFRGMYVPLSITQKSSTLSFHIYYSLFNITKLLHVIIVIFLILLSLLSAICSLLIIIFFLLSLLENLYTCTCIYTCSFSIHPIISFHTSKPLILLVTLLHSLSVI